MAERLTFRISVFVFLEKDGKLFTLRRQNTSFANGRLTIPSGHIEAGETPSEAAIREVREEAGVEIAPADLVPCHAQFYQGHKADDIDYVYYYFKADRYSGTPHNAEPEMASEVVWLGEEGHPDLIRFIQSAWTYSRKGVAYSEFLLKKGESL